MLYLSLLDEMSDVVLLDSLMDGLRNVLDK